MPVIRSGPVAQRITRLTTDQKIAGSNPAAIERNIFDFQVLIPFLFAEDNANENEVAEDEDELLIEENPPRGCWWRFTHCISGMWATKDITNTDDRFDKSLVFKRSTVELQTLITALL